MKTALIITDAWSPQTNGVVTTLQSVIRHLPALGYEARVIHPGLFKTLPLPSYPEIRVTRNPWRIGRMIAEHRPDAVHIATEGPLGLAARGWLCRHLIPFSTSLHTKFPEYVQQRTRLPVAAGYRYLRWFHRPALHTLCTTESHRLELEKWRLRNLVVWGRGVDTERFRPAVRFIEHLPEPPAGRPVRPRLLYVGRIAVEKNVEAFLKLDVPGEKVVVGDGPAREALQARYPDAIWRGFRHGEALAAEYAAADLFVFPSLTDTFGLVMLEAMACGTPVAAFPVTGPRDVVIEGVNGCLDADLAAAARRALGLDRAVCRAYAESQSWQRIAERLAACFTPVDWQRTAGFSRKTPDRRRFA